MARINIIDGNNQFFLKVPKASSIQTLMDSCYALHSGYDIVYWVFDGLDSRKPRRDLFARYKDTASRRKNSGDRTKYELLKEFKHVHLPARGGCLRLEIPFIEADDIIRKLVILLADGTNEITISSNDQDMLDLTRFPKVIQPQAKMPAFCPTPDLIPIYKTLVGDSGDNIKGLKGFGEKAWERLSAADLETLTAKIKQKVDVFDVALEDDKLRAKVEENWEEICLWYKLVDYIDFDDLLIQKHLTVLPKQKFIQHATTITMDGI